MLVNHGLMFESILNDRIMVFQKKGADSIKNQSPIQLGQLFFREKCLQIYKKQCFANPYISHQFNKMYEVVKERCVRRYLDAKSKCIEISLQTPFYPETVFSMILKPNLRHCRFQLFVQLSDKPAIILIRKQMLLELLI